MPVILEPDCYDLWLDPGMRDMGAVSDAEAFRCQDNAELPVSSRVNHLANDDEECSTPVELAQIQNRLF